MAALTVDSARAVRAESRRLCVDSRDLRVAAQLNHRLAIERKERAEAATACRASRSVHGSSPWSRLDWLRDEEALSDVLVLVD